MSTPERIQLRRTRGWRMPPDTVKVDRTTIFGNPFTAEKYGHDRALAMFRAWLGGTLSDNGLPDWALGRLLERRGLVLEALPTLRGKNLACWCPQPAPGEPDKCHAPVLLELANFGGGTKAPGTAPN